MPGLKAKVHRSGVLHQGLSMIAVLKPILNGEPQF
jgi:hypothetical protein